MNQVNYSLLAALWEERTANLFDDIIYPIIGYSVSSLAERQEDDRHYYRMVDIQEVIKDEVGIDIPIVIVSDALKLVSDKEQDVKIYFVDGECQNFSIKRSWSAQRNTRVAKKTRCLQQRKDDLEKQFRSYLDKNGYVTDVTIEDFLYQNMEETLSYMKGQEVDYINENHIHVAKFLVEVKSNDSQQYDVICDIVWGAMIAGLLRTEKKK